MATRTSRGRQKIEMVKIKNQSNLLSTFSKRHRNLFKKASEICSVTGAEIALIFFSPKANTPFSFGSPNVQSVIDRYQNPGRRPNTTSTDVFIQFQRLANLENLNEELTFLENKLKEEEKRSQIFDRIISERDSQYWWEAPTEELNLEQLEQMQMALQNLHPTNMTNELQNIFRTAEDPDPFDETNNAIVEPNVIDPFDGVVQYAALPSTTISGGISVDGAFSLTMMGSSSNHMAHFDLAPTAFGVSQYATFPSSNNGGISINQASWSTMAGSSSNQLDNFDTMEMVSVLEHAGPSRINTPSQLILRESSSTDLFRFDPRAPGSSNSPFMPLRVVR